MNKHSMIDIYTSQKCEVYAMSLVILYVKLGVINDHLRNEISMHRWVDKVMSRASLK